MDNRGDIAVTIPAPLRRTERGDIAIVIPVPPRITERSDITVAILATPRITERGDSCHDTGHTTDNREVTSLSRYRPHRG